MYRQEKEEILRTARKLSPTGSSSSVAGNLSIRRGDHVIVTPSGMDYEGLDSSDMVVVDMKGNVVEGSGRPRWTRWDCCTSTTTSPGSRP